MRNPNRPPSLRPRPLSGLLLGLALAFTACTLSDPDGAPTADPPQKNPSSDATYIRGRWTETVRKDVIYFAGQHLSFDFEADSVLIQHYQFTDMSHCQVVDTVRQCSDFHWTDTYRGAWTLRDSLLQIDFHFVETTASPWTANRPLEAARVEFIVSRAADGGTGLLFERVSPGEFMNPERSFRLERLQP